MRYRDLLQRLQRLTPSQLNQHVMVRDDDAKPSEYRVRFMRYWKEYQNKATFEDGQLILILQNKGKENV